MTNFEKYRQTLTLERFAALSAGCASCAGCPSESFCIEHGGAGFLCEDILIEWGKQEAI